MWMRPTVRSPSRTPIQKRTMFLHQETLPLMPPSAWIASRNQFFRKQRFPFWKVCLKAIMEPSSHMVKLAQERPLPCKGQMRKVTMKREVSFQGPFITSSKPSLRQPTLRNISLEQASLNFTMNNSLTCLLNPPRKKM